MNDWSHQPLAEVAPIDSVPVLPATRPNESFNYIALENIESETGRLLDLRPTNGESIKSNKFIFNTSHVLLGKLRPYLNKVVVPDSPGICSTDILPLRPRSGLLTREFLALCLRSPDFIEYSRSKMEGTKMPRLRTPDLESYEIPIPPLAEQRRIVARVEALTRRLDQARQVRQAALAEAETILASAVSKEMERDGKSGTSMELGQILTKVQYGTSVKASPEPNGLPVIRMGNIQVGAIKTTDLKYLQLPPVEVERYRLEKGDILINRTNSAALVGKAGLFNIEGDYLFASYLIRLRIDAAVADPEFVNYVINSEEGQAYLRGQGKDAIGQTNINSGQIRKMPIRLPDLPHQRATVTGLNALRGKLDELLPLQREVETELAAFVPALLAKAFRGEL